MKREEIEKLIDEKLKAAGVGGPAANAGPTDGSGPHTPPPPPPPGG